MASREFKINPPRYAQESDSKTLLFRFWYEFPEKLTLPPTSKTLPYKAALTLAEELIDSKTNQFRDPDQAERLIPIICHAFPVAGAIDKLRTFIHRSKTLSVGCGIGYWEYLLQCRRKDVICVDTLIPLLSYVKVEKLDAAEATRKYDPECLFLGWPTPQGYDVKSLQLFLGDKIVVLADSQRTELTFDTPAQQRRNFSQWVGSDEFWSAIRKGWKLQQSLMLVSWAPRYNQTPEMRCYVKL